MKKKIAELRDVKDRLLIQKDAAKLCVAESIKDFHEQMQLVLREPVTLGNLGPELMSIDRAKLATSLDISNMRALSKQEEAEMDNRMSAKLSNSRRSITTPSKTPTRHKSPIEDREERKAAPTTVTNEKMKQHSNSLP